MIKAEWTNADALNLQPTCNQLATDCISRQAAIDCVERSALTDDPVDTAIGLIEVLPSAQEIIRCKDCKWWDKYGENHGYCMRVRRWEEYFCADAERREE